MLNRSNMNTISIFLNIFIIANGVNVIHLEGYQILAEEVESITGDVVSCSEYCDTSSYFCSGFKMINSNTECTLLNFMRNIIENSTECNYYTLNRTGNYPEIDGRRNFQVVMLGKTFNELSWLIYYNSYPNPDDRCPFGSTYDATASLCFPDVPINDESKCAEFNEIIKTSFDSTCRITRRVKFFKPCPESWSIYEYPSGHNYSCFTKIDAVTDDANAVFGTYNQTCTNLSLTGTNDVKKAFIATVDSEEENNFIKDNFVETMIGLYIPSSKTLQLSNFEWLNGATYNYRNWVSPEPIILNERYTFMDTSGTWNITDKWKYNYIVCKYYPKYAYDLDQ